MELTKILYTGEATVTGGREGHVRSSDGRRDPKPDLSDSRLTARVGIGPNGRGGGGLAVTLDFHAPLVAREEATELMARAHRVCPYSNATRGNVEVILAMDGVSIQSPKSLS